MISDKSFLGDRFEFIYTPKHGGYLNMAEIELNALSGQCLNRRIGDMKTVSTEVEAWQQHRNTRNATINRQFTSKDARIKLKRLYPTFTSLGGWSALPPGRKKKRRFGVHMHYYLVQCNWPGTRGLKARRTARVVILLLAVICTLFCARAVLACTSITLKGADGTPAVGRTNEWGAFDVKSQLMIVPRGHKIVSSTPDGTPGLTYTAKFGVVGIDALDEMFLADGMNEEGLVVGFLYLPGFTEYMPYDPAKAAQSMGPLEVVLYLLSQFKSVDEVRAGLADIRVVPVEMAALRFPPPMHYRVVDRTGKELVIEYTTGGQPDLYDAPLGVVTNSPPYDWHLTNLRNYLMLTREAKPELNVAGYTLGPIGAGSGQLGLPGDTTPPSRFIQSVVFTQLARPTKGGLDTVNEVFRILDHFNLATPGAEGADLAVDQQLPSATQWTIAADAKNRVFYWHTTWNRRVRMFDLKNIDFGSVRF